MISPQKKKLALYFLDKISKEFPNAKIELCFDSHDPWQLLVAVVLSAQTTDKKVNEVTPALFKAFPDVYAFAKASAEQIEPYIKTLGFFRNKAKSLAGAARMLVEQYQGKLPHERDMLETLPGVGPKSAAVIVANVFGQQAIAVDTHVGRIARRLGLTSHTDPNKVEADLTALLPHNRLLEAHHALIWHGRRICHARKPLCEQCPVTSKCPKVGIYPASLKSTPKASSRAKKLSQKASKS